MDLSQNKSGTTERAGRLIPLLDEAKDIDRAIERVRDAIVGATDGGLGLERRDYECADEEKCCSRESTKRRNRKDWHAVE